jgi:N-acetylmuramoyl-L-alanine amidase
MAELVTKLTEKFPNAKVLGHRDFPNVNKACPCFGAGAWWAEVKKEL